MVRPSDLGLRGCVLSASGVMWGSCGCMLRVLIWCNVGSCSRVSGVMGVAIVVCLMKASGVMGVGVFVC